MTEREAFICQFAVPDIMGGGDPKRVVRFWAKEYDAQQAKEAAAQAAALAALAEWDTRSS